MPMILAAPAARAGVTIILGLLLAACGPAPSPSPTAGPSATLPAPTATPTPSVAPTGISRDRAIATARAAAPLHATDDVLVADVGRFADSVSDYTATHISPAPAPDRLVWRVNLGTRCQPLCASGTTVIIDYWTGRVLIATDWIS